MLLVVGGKQVSVMPAKRSHCLVHAQHSRVILIQKIHSVIAVTPTDNQRQQEATESYSKGKAYLGHPVEQEDSKESITTTAPETTTSDNTKHNGTVQ